MIFSIVVTRYRYEIDRQEKTRYETTVMIALATLKGCRYYRSTVGVGGAGRFNDQHRKMTWCTLTCVGFASRSLTAGPSSKDTYIQSVNMQRKHCACSSRAELVVTRSKSILQQQEYSVTIGVYCNSQKYFTSAERTQ